MHGYRVYIDILVGLQRCKTLRLIHLGTCPVLDRKGPKMVKIEGFLGGIKVNFKGSYLEVVCTISDGCHAIICAWVQGTYIDILFGLRRCKTLRLIHLGTCPGLDRKWPENGEKGGSVG